MKTIELTHEQLVVVDDWLYEELNSYKWYAQWNKDTQSYYARRMTPYINGKRKMVAMHRQIINAPSGILVDHINGNTLDNRLANLRLVSTRENQQNRHKHHSSIFPGVHWSNHKKKWISKVCIDGKSIQIGGFPSEQDAYNTYVEARKSFGLSVENLLNRKRVKGE